MTDDGTSRIDDESSCPSCPSVKVSEIENVSGFAPKKVSSYLLFKNTLFQDKIPFMKIMTRFVKHLYLAKVHLR